MPPLIASAPWIAFVVYLLIKVRLPRPLPPSDAKDLIRTGQDGDNQAPLVSVIVPARNEERSIRSCVESICASDHPNFEVIVVDDRSDDRTLELARGIQANRARRIVAVEGQALPDGWMGKPWACAQGAREAKGELLLFTDADTVHAPDLLGRSVAGMVEDGGDALTLLGRQLMETFWERLVQTHMMSAIVFRFPNPGKRRPPEQWRDAIANGQFILFNRSTYQEIGGHEAVKGEIVEDQRLAQILCRSGKRLAVRRAETMFATRMYRSLGESIEGWSKNMRLAARQMVPNWAVSIVLPAGIVANTTLWLVPPAVLVLSLLLPVGAGAGVGVEAGVATGTGADAGPGTWLMWSAWITGFSALFWSVVSRRLGAPVWAGLFYPLAAGVVSYIFVRSWIRGGRVEWKGREYRV